jgi:hypothetical protein
VATNTNLEKIDGTIAVLEAAESTLRRIDKRYLSRPQEQTLFYLSLDVTISKLKLKKMLEEIKEQEGREPWQNSDT